MQDSECLYKLIGLFSINRSTDQPINRSKDQKIKLLKLREQLMVNDFLFSALGKNEFSKYFDMSEQELADLGAYLFESDQCPCYPCRVSLIDAKIGEKVLAISYEHHGENSPYRSSGPIFIRQTADTAKMEKNEIPEILRHRLLSVRGYNTDKLMIEADTTMGNDIEVLLEKMFENNKVQYIHVHNAGPGCFNCSVTRV